jgi:biopolymer transport protein ExbD
MHFTTRRKRRAPTVIIVSLIDVLLVVLIFLMVTTTAKKEPASVLKLALPTAKQAQPGSKDTKPFRIQIAPTAPYFYLGNTPVTVDRLQTEIQNAAKKDPQLKVAIKADKNAPTGEFIRAIDIAKAANVGSIDAETEKAK